MCDTITTCGHWPDFFDASHLNPNHGTCTTQGNEKGTPLPPAAVNSGGIGVRTRPTMKNTLIGQACNENVTRGAMDGQSYVDLWGQKHPYTRRGKQRYSMQEAETLCPSG